MTSLIGAFKIFDEVYIMYGQKPGPLQSGLTIVYYIFDKFYRHWEFTTASAAAFLLFLVILFFTFAPVSVFVRKEEVMRKGKKMVTVLSYVILAAGLLWVSLPFVWMVLTAFKPAKEVLSMPPKWIPSVWQWENFKMALQQVPYARYFFNSVFTAVMVTVGEVFTTVLAAYAFAYIPFRFKNALFLVLVATMMVPGEILMIPNYITLSNWGWIDSYKALIIPWCASIFSIFLLKQQFESIPISYYKSAKINGCSELRFYLLF